jgi:hypothetical protein
MYMIVVVTLVREALVKMHRLGYAHQDVRHPNVCFVSPSGLTLKRRFETSDLVAVMIDLDRVEVASSTYTTRPKFNGEMYVCGTIGDDGGDDGESSGPWTFAHQDMKQLAMMGLAHHQPDGKEQCTCEYCQELMVVKRKGRFGVNSLFLRERLGMDLLTRFHRFVLTLQSG